MAVTTKRSTEADAVFKALADPSRRRILDLLRKRPRTTGELCGHFEMSRFGVMAHLRVLEEASLVLVRRRGRKRWNALNPVPIRRIYRRWIKPFEESRADQLLRIKEIAESAKKADEREKRGQRGERGGMK